MTLPTALVLAAALNLPAALPETVSVCATQVEASGTRAEEESPRVDPKLKEIRRRLPGRFAAYRWVGEKCWDLAVEGAAAVELPKPYLMRLLREADGEKGIRLRWALRKARETMNASLVEFRNHGFLWVGGIPGPEGGDLFVLLHAHWD